MKFTLTVALRTVYAIAMSAPSKGSQVLFMHLWPCNELVVLIGKLRLHLFSFTTFGGLCAPAYTEFMNAQFLMGGASVDARVAQGDSYMANICTLCPGSLFICKLHLTSQPLPARSQSVYDYLNLIWNSNMMKLH